MQHLQYPIGKFSAPTEFSRNVTQTFIGIIQSFPDKIIAAISNLTEQQLNTPYRPDGWTVRQVVIIVPTVT